MSDDIGEEQQIKRFKKLNGRNHAIFIIISFLLSYTLAFILFFVSYIYKIQEIPVPPSFTWIIRACFVTWIIDAIEIIYVMMTSILGKYKYQIYKDNFHHFECCVCLNDVDQEHITIPIRKDKVHEVNVNLVMNYFFYQTKFFKSALAAQNDDMQTIDLDPLDIFSKIAQEEAQTQQKIWDEIQKNDEIEDLKNVPDLKIEVGSPELLQKMKFTENNSNCDPVEKIIDLEPKEEKEKERNGKKSSKKSKETKKTELKEEKEKQTDEITLTDKNLINIKNSLFTEIQRKLKLSEENDYKTYYVEFEKPIMLKMDWMDIDEKTREKEGITGMFLTVPKDWKSSFFFPRRTIYDYDRSEDIKVDASLPTFQLIEYTFPKLPWLITVACNLGQKENWKICMHLTQMKNEREKIIQYYAYHALHNAQQLRQTAEKYKTKAEEAEQRFDELKGASMLKWVESGQFPNRLIGLHLNRPQGLSPSKYSIILLVLVFAAFITPIFLFKTGVLH